MAGSRFLPISLRGVTLKELRSFFYALRLGFIAQRIARGTPLEQLIDILLTTGRRPPKNLREDEAMLAAARAGHRLQTLGMLNTCLIRSLVAGSLLADREDVTLQLGNRRDETSENGLDGHAWLMLGARVLPHPDEAAAPSGEPYSVMASFPMRRPT